MTSTPQPDCFEFSARAVAYMEEQLGVQAVPGGADGDAYLNLESPQGSIGYFRVWLADGDRPVRKMTYLRVAIEHIGLDVNLFWAFTSRDSVMPHFTCHYNLNPGGQYNFHVDLLPKLDGVAYPDYIDHYFRPLSPSFHRAKDICGEWTRPSEHQYLMSGWGLYGESPGAQVMGEMQEIILDYVRHYCALDELQITDPHLDADYLHRRHDLHLQQLFCRESDPDSYRIMDQLLGRELTDLINDIHVKDGLPG